MSEIYKQTPPPFGHAFLQYFLFDSKYINLNHGSYGSTPKPVFDAAHKLSLEIEAIPDYFHRLHYPPLLIEAREKIAKLIGAKTDECVFVTNASTGINTILRNFEWEEGDLVLCTTTTYNSVSRTVHYLGDISPHPTVSVFPLDFPTTRAEILNNFRAHLRTLPYAPNKKRVAVIDSIASNPGTSLPWKEMTKICKEEGVWSVIDAAHSIGQEVDINLSEAEPDFWVSNCHKWLLAKRAVAVLYVPERNQHLIKSSIPTAPLYLSPAERKGPNFVDQFEWHGTIDFTAYLTIPEVLRFREWSGGEKKINEYCHDLALRGGKRLVEVLGTRLLDPTGEFTLNMVDVELPFTRKFTPEIDLMFKHKLLVDRKIYAAHHWHNGHWWTRCSAQIWNEVEDFEKMGRAWLDVCAEVEKELDAGGNIKN